MFVLYDQEQVQTSVCTASPGAVGVTQHRDETDSQTISDTKPNTEVKYNNFYRHPLSGF